MKTALYKNKNFTWWDLENPTEQELVALLKENNINTGNLKDVMDPLHLPKFEENDTYYFSILRLYECDKPEALESIQELTHKLAFYISDSFIVSVHRLPILRLKDVVSKLNNTESTSCYVGLRLMRLAFRSYEQPLLQFDNELEEIENNMMRKNKLRNSILHLYHVKRKNFSIMRLLKLHSDCFEDWSECINEKKLNPTLLNEITDMHTQLETQQSKITEEIATLFSLYFSLTTQRNNDNMAFLTVLSSIFLPLTFIVGLYGMNFKYMPELEWHYGYYMVISCMVVITLGIIIWFKKRKIF